MKYVFIPSKTNALGRKMRILWFVGKHMSNEWKTFEKVGKAGGHVNPLELQLKSREVAACALT